MKILLLKDLYYLDHLILESVRPSSAPTGQPAKELYGWERSPQKIGVQLEVDRDEDSETAEPEEGHSWFDLSDTGNRFKIQNDDLAAYKNPPEALAKGPSANIGSDRKSC